MVYTIDNKSDEQVIIATFAEPHDIVNDSIGVAEALLEALAATEGNLHYIANLSQIKINFGDLTLGMATAFRDPNSPYSNPRLKTYTVSTDMLAQLGTQAANEQEQYSGAQEIKIFDSVDDAMEAINVAKSTE